MPPDSRTRRTYAITLVAGLLASTAVAVGVSRPWMSATATVPGLPTIRATASGAELSPIAGALGVVLLAAFGAVVATGGWVRRGIGGLICVAALVVLVAALRPPDAATALQDGLSARGWSGGDYATDTEVWRWLVAAAAALCCVAGAEVAHAGARWPTMGSRYEAPAGQADAGGRSAVSAAPVHSVDAALTDEDVWREIDRGHDPTQNR